MMKTDELLRFLKTPMPLKAFDALDSTNSLARAWAQEGLDGPGAVFADRQQAGRGRRGRSFFSPAGGIYMSLVVDSPGIHPGQLTTLAAVAVAAAVRRQTGRELHIKWVNDLLLDGKKVCGILTEGVLINSRLAKSVIGIGINTGPADFPDGLVGIAGTLHSDEKPVHREELSARVINEILEGLPLIPKHIQAYRARCITLGRRVRFCCNNQFYEGIARDVDDEGALLVQTREGLVPVIAGEVSLMKEPFLPEN